MEHKLRWICKGFQFSNAKVQQLKERVNLMKINAGETVVFTHCKTLSDVGQFVAESFLL